MPWPNIPGDLNNNGAVDAADLAQWQGDFGASADSDADNVGDSVGADFLAWQRQLGGNGPAISANAPVPEPATLLLVIVATAGIGRVSARKHQELVNA